MGKACMASMQRFKTDYPGVFFIMGTSTDGKAEKIYYITYRKEGKLTEEKAGRQFLNNMTPKKASELRVLRMRGIDLSNRARRAEAEGKGNSWTINRLWDEYRNCKPDLKGRSREECTFDNHIRKQMGNREPSDIRPTEMDRYRNTLLQKYQPQTVYNVLELTRRIINFGVKKQLCQGLSFKIEMPRVDNKRTEFLTPEQLKNLLIALDEEIDIQAANMIRMALFTGMRRGELCKLEWRDIDFDRGFILIRGPKGGKDETIPLTRIMHKNN